MNTAPVLFISHGAPTFALEPGILGPQLTQLGQRVTEISAVLVVSAHWQTRNVNVMTTARPETVHDFGGFPPALYQLTYPAPGAPEMAAEAGRLLTRSGYVVSFDDRRGLDHGVWVPLRYLFPRANAPVFQVSLPHALDAAGAMRLGATLRPLRERGVMIIGSGSLTHNLHDVRQSAAGATGYVREFSAWVRQRVVSRESAALADYRKGEPNALRAHPTEEHFLPLLVAQGASDPTDAVRVIDGGITHGVLSMDSYIWGSGRDTDVTMARAMPALAPLPESVD